MKFFFTSVFFVLFSVVAGAQQRVGSFMAYGRDNGLPAALNYTVLESSDRYLWIATSSGLVRFDGQRFKTFYADYSNPNSLSDNYVIDLVEDENQNLWICGLSQGITKYHLRTGVFTRYPRLSRDKSAEYGIYRVFKDHRGTLWFATAGRGLAEYVPEADTFRIHVPNPDEPSDGSVRGANYVTDICEDRFAPGILWITAFDGLYRFDTESRVFTRFIYFSDKNLPGQIATQLCIRQDIYNRFWIGTWGFGLVRFDPVSETFYHFSKLQVSEKNTPGRSVVIDMEFVSDSVLFLGCINDGLVSFNIRTGEMLRLLTTSMVPGGSGGIDIQRVSLTPNAGIFASGNYFIYQQHPAFSRMNRFVPLRNPDPLKGDIYINEVVYDPGRLCYWLAGHNTPGLIRFSPSEIKTAIIPFSKDQFNIYLNDVSISGDNRIWFTGNYSGLMYLDAEGKIRKAGTLFDRDPASAELFREVETDSSGNLWLAGGNKACYWDIRKNRKTFFELKIDTALAYTVRQFLITGLKIDKEQNAWISTNSGLFHILKNTGKINHIYPKNQQPDQMASLFIRSMVQDMQGRIWLGYMNSGIQQLDPVTYKVVMHHTLDNGLPSMQVNSLASDQQGMIWAGTASGLCAYNTRTGFWHMFNRDDGIRRDFFDRPVMTTSDGAVFLDQINGFIFFRENEYPYPHPPLKVNLTSVLVDGRSADIDHQDEFRQLSLGYRTRELVFEYGVLDPVYPRRVRYAYRVEGIHRENEWVNNPEARFSLSGLRPGNYLVRIRAVNSIGAESNVLEFPVFIATPIWQKWWFYLILVAVVCFIIYRVYIQRLQQKLQAQILRNTISGNLHDDIGASITNIHMLNELAKTHIDNPEKATQFLTKSGEDIQYISESLSDIVWNINPKYDDLDQLLIRMKRYAADLLENHGIQMDFQCPDNLQKIRMSMDQRRDFYLIFKEALNNLIKYSGTQKADILIAFSDGNLSLTVRDTGKGFDLNLVHTGNGLQNMEQRASKWKGRLKVSASPGRGTSIQIIFPVN